jgi:hypothetical protein
MLIGFLIAYLPTTGSDVIQDRNKKVKRFAADENLSGIIHNRNIPKPLFYFRVKIRS